jgi:hypothetical protein
MGKGWVGVQIDGGVVGSRECAWCSFLEAQLILSGAIV